MYSKYALSVFGLGALWVPFVSLAVLVQHWDEHGVSKADGQFLDLGK